MVSVRRAGSLGEATRSVAGDYGVSLELFVQRFDVRRHSVDGNPPLKSRVVSGGAFHAVPESNAGAGTLFAVHADCDRATLRDEPI